MLVADLPPEYEGKIIDGEIIKGRQFRIIMDDPLKEIDNTGKENFYDIWANKDFKRLRNNYKFDSKVK